MLARPGQLPVRAREQPPGRAAGSARRHHPPFPLPILRPADGVEPVDGVLAGPALGLLRREAVLSDLLPYVGPGWYPKVLLAAVLDLGVCRWDHIVLGISARSHVDAATLRRALERVARGREAHGQAQRKRDDRPVGAQHGGGRQRAQQQQNGADADFFQAFACEGGHGVGLRPCGRLLWTQLDMALWADLACVGLNADVKFLLLRELFPSKPGWPDTTLVISHSKRMAVNAAANRALAPDLKAPQAGGHPHGLLQIGANPKRL